MRDEAISRRGWLSEWEFLDLVWHRGDTLLAAGSPLALAALLLPLTRFRINAAWLGIGGAVLGLAYQSVF